MNKFLTTLSLCLCVLLSACDGGLFGTGDGDPIVPIDATAPGMTGNGDSIDGEGEAAGGSNGEPSSMTPGSGAETPEADLTSSAFENLTIGGNQSDPLLSLVNTSTQAISLSANGMQLTTTAITAGQTSATLTVPLGTTMLSLLDETGDTLFRLDPLGLASMSVSLLIVRDSISNPGSIDLIPLSTQTRSVDAAVALVRLIQIDPLADPSASTTGEDTEGPTDDNDATADFVLMPAGTAGAPAEVTFIGVSYQRNPATAYMSAGPGDYLLTDSLGRFEPVSLTLEGGQVYSLLIANGERGLLVNVDSRIAQ